MKIRFKNKLYNTNNIKTRLEKRFDSGYYNSLYSFEAEYNIKIFFQESKFTNFDDYVYLESWSEDKRSLAKEIGLIEISKANVYKIN